MSETLAPDLCVIGAGAAGLSVAAAAAGLGASVVLIERGAMGGECLNVGCVPSKALIAAARRAHEAREAGRFGVRTGEVTVDFAAVMAHVRGAIAAIAPTDSAERYAALGVRVIRVEARFADRRTVEAGGVAIRARRTVIATGSSPKIPPIRGLDATPFLTNETVFGLEALPRSLLILGAGAIGLELAQAFRRLGSQVTVLDPAAPLAREDPELVAPALEALAREGVKLLAPANILEARGDESGVTLTVEDAAGPRDLSAERLLVAAGRTPRLDGLGIEAAGIRRNGDALRLSRGLRTTNRRVFAIGDAAGGGLTHVAGHQAGLVGRSALFGLPVAFDPAPLPRVIFTDPEIAWVGLDEASARTAHKTVSVLRWPFHENDRARTDGRTDGHVKVVTDSRGRALGAGIVGADAGELIHLWAAAVQRRWRLVDLAALTLPYPTRGEVSRRVALLDLAARLTNPWVGRIIRAVRKLP